jgi:predicted dehydrogenase
MSEFKIGLVGGGGISRAHLAAAIASGGRVRVVAAADPSPQARQRLGEATGGAPVFASVDEMLSRDVDLDGLVVCTPPNARIPIVKAALARGVAVLVEKPLAHTLHDARELANLAAQHPRVPTAVGYCHRFVPAVNEMKRRLDAGELGELVRFENVFASYLPSMRNHWMSDAAVSGGGALIDTGCHSLDLFRHLVGDATVTAAAFQNAWPGRGESSATVFVQSTRAPGVINSGWLEPTRFTIGLIGTRASLLYDYDRPTELVVRPSEGGATVVSVDTHETRFAAQLIALAGFTRGGPASDLASFGDGLRVAELVDQAQRRSII